MNVRPVPRQRGAVTLIGALFLIFSIIVLLGAVQRMAASSITDSALHNDGIEALYIAESGLERAAWRYAGGNACAALAGETDTIGRGTFTVQSAALLGTVCRVRVAGSVITTLAANTVTRTIDGDLVASGDAGGWAVGDVDGGELIIHWDGSSWSRSGPYAGIPDVPLHGVHCVAGNDCWAVGDNSGGELIIHWDGGSWSRSGPYAGIPDVPLHSVHCVAGNDCWAVGDNSGGELIIHWDGSSWSRSGPYAGIPDVPLHNVHCVAGNDCWAAGDPSGGELIIHWDGSSWSRSGPYGSVPDQVLYSVYCVAGNDCWAVGEQNGGSANINHWNGSSWSSVASGSVPGKDLASVHCAASNDCWAVGVRSGYENINHWNGTSWNRLGNIAGLANKDMNAVYMVSASEGYLVGQNGVIATWDGSNWSGQTSPTNSDLNAVCAPAGTAGGGVALMHWSEVIQ